MTALELVTSAHSLAYAVGGLLVGTLPLLSIAIYHALARLCNEVHLPVRLHNLKVVPLVLEPTEMTAVWN